MDTVIEIIVALVLLIPALGKLLAKVRGGGGEGVKPGVNPGVNPGGNPEPAPQPARKTLQSEIEGFLRRVADAAQEKEKPPAAKRTQQRKASAPKPKPIVAQKAAPRAVGGEVTEHVRKHLDSSKFQRRSQKMGGEVLAADEKFEQRMHGAFDHKLGSLDSTPTDSQVASSSQATQAGVGGQALAAPLPLEVAAIFASPESIRQAIIINEIMQRPVHRW